MSQLNKSGSSMEMEQKVHTLEETRKDKSQGYVEVQK